MTIRARNKGTSRLDLPTLQVGADPGEVFTITEEQAQALAGLPEVELLDELVLSDTGGVKVTSFEPHVEDVVAVAKTSAGSVVFPDGTEVVWSNDGDSVDLTPEQAEQLRDLTGEFGFDGDAAPEKTDPTAAPTADEAPVVDETPAKASRRKAVDTPDPADSASADAPAAQA